MKRLVQYIFLAILAVMLVLAVAACSGDKADKLEVPTNIQYSMCDGLITWDDNIRADAFVVEINGIENPVLDAEFNIDLEDKSEQYVIRIKAVSKTYADSDWSAEVIRGGGKVLCEITDDRTAYNIVGCTDLSGPALLPSRYDGLPVIGISHSAFYECEEVTSVIIPNSVTQVGENAFYKCGSLTNIAIPNSVTSIGRNAFFGCSSLTSVVIPDSVTKIGFSLFKGCSSLTNIKIPDSVTSIDYSAFRDCSSLTSVIIPNSVSYIGNAAFSDCSSLTNVTISESIEIVNPQMFDGCSALANITIPNSVKRIGNGAFYGVGLLSVNIPKSVTEIGIMVFGGCNNLTEITVDKDNPNYKSENNCLLNKEGNILVVGCRSSVIPQTVTEIGDYAFCGYSWLTELIVPPQITKIGVHAYFDCCNLSRVFVPITVNEVLAAFDITVIMSGLDIHVEEHVPRPVTYAVDTIYKPGHYLGAGICVYTNDKEKANSKQHWVCELDYDNEIYPYVVSININSRMQFISNDNLVAFFIGIGYFPKRIGYDCKGFSLTPGGSILFTKEDADAIIARVKNGENVNIYPVWTPREQS
ncbi:MAG: leucine-rich repeat domain-containing protein [Clostridiales bacterium]|nr:leucine-rich repeat domain-containing protein [Clostridiales bacterium]